MRLAPPSPAAMSETDHQKLCVDYARKLGLGPYLIAIPNGTQLPGGPVARAKYMRHLKAMGLTPGASDLFLAKPHRWSDPGGNDGWYHGAWFEMKRLDGGRTSKEQKAFLTEMQRQSYYVDVCAGFDEFCKSLQYYMDGRRDALWPNR